MKQVEHCWSSPKTQVDLSVNTISCNIYVLDSNSVVTCSTLPRMYAVTFEVQYWPYLGPIKFRMC